MAKRYTDSRKWDDAWFVGLEAKYRFLWIYILDKCNHCGIYQSIPALEKFNLNYDYNWIEVNKVFSGRIKKLPEDCYFIPKFVKFQYSNLKQNTPLYISIKNYLKDKNLLQYIGSDDEDIDHSATTVAVVLPNTIEIENGITLTKEKEHIIYSKGKIPPSIEEVALYCKERKNGVNPESWYNHYEAKGWLIGKTKMKNWQAAVRTWENKSTAVKNPYDEVK